MKYAQKKYELGFNSLDGNPRFYEEEYFRSIDAIKSRPNRYIFPPPKKYYIKNIYEPYKDLFVIQENKELRLRLNSIESRPSLPKINNDYLELKERMRSNRDKSRELYKSALTIENDKITERIFSQRPRVENPRWVEKLYEASSEHSGGSVRRRNNEKNNSNYSLPLILPKISSRNIHANKKKKNYAKTDANVNSDNEKNNSIELQEHKYKEISHQKPGHID
jgi:hypothetical protein